MLQLVDFFCGAGGMSCGFESAGIDVIAGIDIDPTVTGTYQQNHPKSKFICKDINLLEPEDLAKEVKIKKNDKNLIFIACSPCQFWTILRTSKDSSKMTRNLLKRFCVFVEHFKPGYVVIENVPGILKNESDSGLEQFLSILNKFNYSFDKEVINTSHYGVPQSRKRFILIASRNINNVKIPLGKADKKVTVADCIGKESGLSRLSAGETDSVDDLHRASNLSKLNLTRIQKTSHNGGSRLEWKDNPDLQLETYKGKDFTFRTSYGRMKWDEVSPTITTKFFSITNGRFGHPEQNRGVSLREGALLQTFPKSYKFVGSSILTIAKQIGNAVPPAFAKVIALYIKKNHNID